MRSKESEVVYLEGEIVLSSDSSLVGKLTGLTRTCLVCDRHLEVEVKWEDDEVTWHCTSWLEDVRVRRVIT